MRRRLPKLKPWRERERGREREIEAAGGEAVTVQADVGKRADVAAMFQAIGKALGRLDILVNNAAIGKGGPLLELSEEDFDAVRPQPACAARLPGRPMTAPDQFAVAGAPPAPIALQPPLGGLSPPVDNMAGL